MSNLPLILASVFFISDGWFSSLEVLYRSFKNIFCISNFSNILNIVIRDVSISSSANSSFYVNSGFFILIVDCVFLSLDMHGIFLLASRHYEFYIFWCWIILHFYIFFSFAFKYLGVVSFHLDMGNYKNDLSGKSGSLLIIRINCSSLKRQQLPGYSFPLSCQLRDFTVLLIRAHTGLGPM